MIQTGEKRLRLDRFAYNFESVALIPFYLSIWIRDGRKAAKDEFEFSSPCLSTSRKITPFFRQGRKLSWETTRNEHGKSRGEKKKKTKKKNEKKEKVGGTTSHCSNRSVAGQKGIY